MTDGPSREERIQTLGRHAAAAAASLGISSDEVSGALESGDYFSLLEILVPMRAGAPADLVHTLTGALEGLLRIKTFAFPPPFKGGGPAPGVFGTGGHRGEIGVGLTLAHVHVIVLALMKQSEALSEEEVSRLVVAATAGEDSRETPACPA